MPKFAHTGSLHLLLLAVAALIVYSNTFSVPFQFDDSHFIVENPIVKDLSYFVEPSKAKPLLGEMEYKTFISRYFAYMTFAINYRLHGLEVAGYHVVNLLIHIINAFLVYAFVIVTFRTPYLASPFENIRGIHGVVALFSALLFVSHPIQTQAVTYIWQRTTELAATFYIGSIVLYAKWRLTSINPSLPPLSVRGGEGGVTQKVKRWRIYFYLASLLCAVLAMKTKENAFTLPVALALYEFMFFPSSTKKRNRLLFLIPLFLTMPLVPLAHMQDLSFGSMGEAMESNPKLTRWAYLLTSFRVMVTYLRLIFLPVNQNLDYDYPSYQSFCEPAVFLSFLLLVSIFGFGVYLFVRKRDAAPHTRLIAYPIFWFFMTLSVESSFLNLVDIIFEHRMYLPSVGVFTAITACGFTLASSLGARKIVMAAFIAAAVIFSGAAYARNSVWKSRISLWEDTVRKSPKHYRAHDRLGQAYADAGRIDDAIEHFEKAESFGPFKLDAGSYFNRAKLYGQRGVLNKEIENYERGLMLKPYKVEALVNLGAAYLADARFQDAAVVLLKATVLDPGDDKAYNNLGSAYFSLKRYGEARDSFTKAAGANPSNPEPRYNLVMVSLFTGDLERAKSERAALERLSPEYALRLNNDPDYVKFMGKRP